MNMNYNNPYMDKYSPPEDTARTFDQYRQKKTHQIKFDEKDVQRQPKQKMSPEKKVLERPSHFKQPLYNSQGRIMKNNSGLKFERQKEMPLAVGGSTSFVSTRLQSFPGDNTHANTSEGYSFLQLGMEQEMSKYNTWTNDDTLERSTVIPNFLNYNRRKVAEDNLGLKFSIQQENPLAIENNFARTPDFARFMDSTPSRNLEEELKTQDEVILADQKALKTSLGISSFLENNWGRDAEDILGSKFKTQQRKSYTNESTVGRTLFSFRFMDSAHQKKPEGGSHLQLNAQKEMPSIDGNTLKRFSGDSRPLKNICTEIPTPGISNPLNKTNAFGTADENWGSLRKLCFIFPSEGNSEFGDLKETSKSQMDEIAQITSNFRRIPFSPCLPKYKSEPVTGENIHNLKKIAIAQRSTIYELIKSYSERINEAHQTIRANGIRILNVVEIPFEDTTQVVLNMFRQIMNVSVDFADIESCQRKYACGGCAKPIVVRFYSSRIKTMVISQKNCLSGTIIQIEEELSQDMAELLKVASTIFGKKNVEFRNGCIAVSLSDGKIMNFSSFSKFKEFLRTSAARFQSANSSQWINI